MRWITLSLMLGLLLFAVQGQALAQNGEDNSQTYFVHEDVVMPAKVNEYEQAAKGVVEKLKEHGMIELKHAVGMTNDFRYFYIYEIDKMADLDLNPWADMQEKMGKEAMDAMWEGYDDTYHSHRNYLLRLRKDLSYNSGDIMDENNLYRHYSWYYIDPDKGDEARAVAEEWKALYESKNIEQGYRIYTGDIGTETPLYLVVQWAKDATDFAAQTAKSDEMLGDEAKELMQKTMAITNRYDEMGGWMRPDLSYMPAEKMTSN